MSVDHNQKPEDQILVDRVGQVSLRMMAGTVPPEVVDHLQARLLAESERYPWEEVVETILAETADPQELVNQGLRAQRDWIARGGAPGGGAAPVSTAPRAAAAASSQPQAGARGRRAPSLKTRGKTFLAAAIVKGGFAIIYTLAIVLLLVLIRHKYPSLDIYRILEWLRDALPGVFGR